MPGSLQKELAQSDHWGLRKHPKCFILAVVLKLRVILHILAVFSDLRGLIELIPFAMSQASWDTSLDYPQHIIPITLKIHFFKVRPIFGVVEQARIWWNSDFFYINPIYDTQGNLGNRENKKNWLLVYFGPPYRSMTLQKKSCILSRLSISVLVIPVHVPAPESKEGTMAFSQSSQAAIIPPMACILKSSIIDCVSNVAPVIFPALSAIVAAQLALTPFVCKIWPRYRSDSLLFTGN